MPMEHLRVPKNSLKRVRVFKIELEFAGVGCFLLKYLEKKPLGATERTINKLNPNMVSTPGLEPKPHCSGRRVLSPLQPARRQ